MNYDKLSPYFSFSRWNRVRIVEIPADGKYEVFYLDYGDQEEVAKEWLHPTWNNILMVGPESMRLII